MLWSFPASAADWGLNVYGPVAAYEWRSVTLNVTYFPRISNFNDINTLAFWLTVWPNAWQ